MKENSRFPSFNEQHRQARALMQETLRKVDIANIVPFIAEMFLKNVEEKR